MEENFVKAPGVREDGVQDLFVIGKFVEFEGLGMQEAYGRVENRPCQDNEVWNRRQRSRDGYGGKA